MALDVQGIELAQVIARCGHKVTMNYNYSMFKQVDDGKGPQIFKVL
jgi:hypothetical protein